MLDGLLLAVVLAASLQSGRPAGSVADVHIQGRFRLHAVLVKPEGSGPFRAIVYNHGSKRDSSYKDQAALGAWFRDHGYVVLFLYRPGVNGSKGTYWKDIVDRSPSPSRYARMLGVFDAESEDILDAVAWLRKRPFVDPHRVAVAGCSFGGSETLLALDHSKDVFAGLDFAGASMRWARSPRLRRRLRRAVLRSDAPIFFLQAANDFDTAPTLNLAELMHSAGKPSLGRIYPPHGSTPSEGHAGFCFDGMDEWGNDVLAFLDDASRGAR